MRLNQILHKSIYTSGLTGFIGKNLLPGLLEQYDHVLNFHRDNKATIHTKNYQKSINVSQKLIKTYNSKYFIHLATLYRPHSKSLNELEETIQSNVTFVLNLIETYLPKEIEIINISSYMQLLDIKYQNTYSLSKEIINIYLKDNKFRHKNIYLFDSFGKKDTRNKVVDIFIKKIMSDQIIKIPVNNIEINLSCVEDICTSIIRAIDMPDGNYSVMSGTTITLDELLNILIEIIGKKVAIERGAKGINYMDKVLGIPTNIFHTDSSVTFKERLEERINEIKET